MWELTIYQDSIIQYLGTNYQEYRSTPWKRIVVPIERIAAVYSLFHELYGKRVIDIKQIK